MVVIDRRFPSGIALVVTIFGLLLTSANAVASGGACPASSPLSGNTSCYFIAANGSDSNNGTSESTPWLHAPGMPNCSGTCATVQGSFGSAGSSVGGTGLIFRGGDTWHFGNSSATPYTGGSWAPQWDGNQSTCVYEGTLTGCFYMGVDTTWYNSSVCGSSWCRPIMSGDNSTSTSTVSSCTYQSGNSGGTNDVILNISASPYQYIDSFEFTGLCVTTNGGAYILNNGLNTPPNTPMMTFYVNLYMHGWTANTATASGSSLVCTIFQGGALMTFDHVVVDGSDSNPGTCAWGIFPDIHHMRDSIFRYTTQGVANWCHDIHDNIFEHFYSPYIPTHGNALECNVDATGNAEGQPQNTPNVYYNNLMRHFDPSMGNNGQVDLWFCPTAIPEYWFNNLMYDLNPTADQGSWDYAGPSIYPACPNTGGQYMFNNTLVDTVQPCYVSTVSHGGQYLTIANEHLINSPLDSGTTACTGYNSSTNIAMSDATATSQGYTTGTAGTAFTNTCANDSTTPCSPTSASDGTVGAGSSEQSYCTAVAGYTQEYAIYHDAASACQYGTTDACAYNSTTHTMTCPAQLAVVRPATWNTGAYQFGGAPVAPTNLVATAH
jgi:hypothetical protein